MLCEQLTAAQLWDWFTLFAEEPWGETRADLRTWADAALRSGCKNVSLAWPYLAVEMTPEEFREEMQRMEDLVDHGNRRENLDPN